MRTLLTSLAAVLSLTVGNAQADIAHELDGHNCFLLRPDLEKVYFCQCTDTPVALPSEGPDQLKLQLIHSIIGISRDPRDGHLIIKKLAIFQAIDRNGRSERRYTERVIPLGQARESAGGLDAQSDEPAQGMPGTRRTTLHLDSQGDTGTIRIQLWKQDDRSQPPSFDNVYKFRYEKVRS